MVTQRIPHSILLFALLLAPFLLNGCIIDGCDCEEEIAAAYEEFGPPEEMESVSENGNFEMTLRYIELGFEKNFTWGDDNELCCNESTKTITEDDEEEGDEEPDDGEEDPGDDDPGDDDPGDDDPGDDDPGDDDPGNDDPGNDDPGNDEPETEDNNQPIPIDQTVYPQLEGDKEIELMAIDPDFDPLTYEIKTLPTKGSLNQLESEDGLFTYTPNDDVVDGDKDEFTFVANDGQADSQEATVTIIFGNKAPEARNVEVSLTVNPDNEISIQLDGFDRNDDILTYELVDIRGVTEGTLNEDELDVNLGTISYTQGTGAYEEEFTYKVTEDGENAESDVGTVTIIVSEPKVKV